MPTYYWVDIDEFTCYHINVNKLTSITQFDIESYMCYYIYVITWLLPNEIITISFKG